MTTTNGSGKELWQLVEQFKAGAQLFHEGRDEEDNAVAQEGKSEAHDAVRELDALSPHGRHALIPLLGDPDPSIRVCAAIHLTDIVPDLAIEALKDIDTHCGTSAAMTAYWALAQRGLR